MLYLLPLDCLPFLFSVYLQLPHVPEMLLSEVRITWKSADPYLESH